MKRLFRRHVKPKLSNKYLFTSDNCAGIHPQVLKAIQSANLGHVCGYGDDPYTRQALALFKKSFGESSQTFFVCNGTAGNVLALQAILKPYEAVICTDQAHIHVDECGALERHGGCKLLTVPSENGKLRVKDIAPFLEQVGFEHAVQPKVISISQSTESGTVYTIEELHQLIDFAKQNHLLVHVDGARIANAVATLGVSLSSLTTDLGIDLLTFGGTKNGLMFGEAIVIFNAEIAKQFKFIRKQGMQLLSKMRFLSIQFHTLLSNNLYLHNARHANEMAEYLAEQCAQLPHVKISKPVESNMVYATLPKEILQLLQKTYYFYVMDPKKSEARWVTSFDTTRNDVDNFIEVLSKLGV